MLRIAKISLCVAPMLLASLSGCATPAWMSSTKPEDPQQARINRLLAVASEFEAKGDQNAAMRVYDHVIAQQPDHPLAVERRELLAQRLGNEQSAPNSIPSHPLATPGPQYLAQQGRPPVQTQTARSAEEIAAEIRKKNEELAQQLAQKYAPPVVAEPQKDTGLTPTPAITESTPQSDSLLAQNESAGQQRFSITPVMHDPGWGPADSRIDETPVETSFADAATELSVLETTTNNDVWTVSETESLSKASESAPTSEDNWAATSESASPDVELASTSPAEAEETPSKEAWTADDAWRTTDLTRSVASSEPVVDENWSKTRLVTLCEDLPEDLVPVVEMLESPNPKERMAALRTLSEEGERAKNASVAIHALLKDADPVIAVQAAGTLRETTGDAWDSVHTLARHLNSDNADVVELAAYLLGQMGPEAMDAVPSLEQLRDSNSGLASLHAAEALTRIAPADTKSIEKLCAALKDSDPQTRWFAAVSLGTITGENESKAAEALKAALEDENAEVRIAACLSLGGLGSQAETAIPVLEGVAHSDAPEVRSAAEMALACLRG